VKIAQLRCNSYVNPNQIDDKQPTFSWRLESNSPGIRQSAYELQVELETFDKKREIVWNSGKLLTDKSLHVLYDGTDLTPNSTYFWHVKVWINTGSMILSKEAYFETGLMGEGWNAKWIGYDKVAGEPYDKTIPFYCADDFDCGENQYYLPPVPYLRKDFIVQKKINKAKLYVSAFGLAEIQINGKKAGMDYFVPGLSAYHNTVYARAYHVEDMLQEKNAIGILLGDGWYAGYMGLNSREWYGSEPRAMVQLELLYEDGDSQSIITDASWRAGYGGLLESDILQGETYDANQEPVGWSKYKFDDTSWEPVSVDETVTLIPNAHRGVPVVEHSRLRPVSFLDKTKETRILDFGRIIAGVLELHLKGPKGSKVIIHHAESLDENGELYTRGNRSARCQDTYILSGKGIECFRPRFTYHGFRYTKIYRDKDVKLLSTQAVEIGSELSGTSYFECSSEIVNHIFQMIKNTQRNNQLEIPTDCCARDERLGWGMEGNHFLYAMTYLNNQENFIRKWCHDIWEAQRESGVLEAIAPPVLMKDIEQFVGDLQSNHGVHMIYALYRIYGNKLIIYCYKEKLKKYFDYIIENSDRNIRFATGCDWLGILAETGHSDLNHGYGECSQAIVGTGHYALAVRQMAEMMEAIEDYEGKNFFLALYEDIRKAFQVNFIQRNGTLRNGKQGDYVIALACGFFSENTKYQAFNEFVRLLKVPGGIEWRGGTATTPYLLQVLKEYGREDLANQFLTSDKYPSLGYMYVKGATSVWERWDAIYQNNDLHPQAMNALSHIGHTVIAQYIIGGLLGIDNLEPGYKKILIAPGPSAAITSAKGSYESCYGVISAQWEMDKHRFHLLCKIPANTTARIIIPCKDIENLTMEKGVYQSVHIENGQAFMEVLSGTYAMYSEL